MSFAMRICEVCCKKMSDHYVLTEYLDEPERDRVCELCRSGYKGRLLYLSAKPERAQNSQGKQHRRGA